METQQRSALRHTHHHCQRLTTARVLQAPLLPSTRSLSPREWLHQLILWAVIGLLVDHFYQFQAHFIGQEANALNVLAKILLDQFVFAPFIILPFIVIWFALDEATYRPKIWLQSLNVGMICRRVAPIWCQPLLLAAHAGRHLCPAQRSAISTLSARQCRLQRPHDLYSKKPQSLNRTAVFDGKR